MHAEETVTAALQPHATEIARVIMPGSKDGAANFISGGMAGMTVDLVLFPLDSLKTLLQAKKEHVTKPRSMYTGLTSAMIGSFPAAAAFFTTYEYSKKVLHANLGDRLPTPMIHMMSAGFGEIFGCAVRVPFELVKQQMQIGMHDSMKNAVRSILTTQGPRGFFVGYWTTVAREIPFDAIEFALWEKLKLKAADGDASKVSSLMSACCGSVAGGFAAAVTTPLDVAKTRLMTQGQRGGYTGLWHALTSIYREEGFKKLFLGIGPRVTWISLGGFVFFGGFEMYKKLIFGL